MLISPPAMKETADLERVIKAATAAEAKVALCMDDAALGEIMNIVMQEFTKALWEAPNVTQCDNDTTGNIDAKGAPGPTALPDNAGEINHGQDTSSYRRIELGELPQDSSMMVWSMLHRHYSNLENGLGKTRRDHKNRYKVALGTQRKFHEILLKHFRQAEAEAFAIDGLC